MPVQKECYRLNHTLRILRNTIIILLLTLTLIFLIEVTIRIILPQDTKIIFVNNQSTGLEDSILGHVLRPESHSIVKTPEYSVEYRINREGMRDEALHKRPKSTDTTRVLLIGDSFTYGEANNYDDIWPVIFERKILEEGYDADIIKAGVPGFDTTKELQYLKRLYPIYKPDIVVFVFLPNDLFTNRPLDHNSSTNYNWTVRARTNKKTQLHSLILFKRLLLEIDYIYSQLYYITPRSQYFIYPMTNQVNNQIELTKNLFLEAAAYCKERNAEFIVVSIPQQFQILVKSKYGSNDIDVDMIDSIFLEYSREAGFLWIPTLTDLTDKYNTTGTDQYFRLDGHLNKNGNLIIGNYVSDVFTDYLKNH